MAFVVGQLAVFKARAKRPYLSHTGRASNAEKQPTGHGPEGCVENGPAAALLVGYLSIQICAPSRLAGGPFERNDVTIICETVHYRSIFAVVVQSAGPRTRKAKIPMQLP